jgi:hypothetical protein
MDHRTISPLIIALMFPVSSLFAAKYYVANSGSDQNDGRSPAFAVATLTNAKTKLSARDTLLLNRGDVFRDSLTLSSLANPTIGAYGADDLPIPVVSGSDTITGWNQYSGTVWWAPCSKKIEKLFVNNTLMTLARYPDTGWLTIDTVTENSDGTNTVIRDAALAQHPRNAANYWTNAQIRWRRWSWWFETRRISAYNQSGLLTLAGQSVIHIMGDSGCKGWHFYIDNKFQELDAPGEWYYDSVAGRVYLYPPGGANPSTLLVEGAYRKNGIVLAGGTVDNVCFRHQTLYGLSLSSMSTVSQCRFEGIGGDGGGTALRASWDIANSHIYNNVFENNLNIGISWYENSGRKGTTIIENDTLINTGTVPGYGGTGTWHAVGILVHLSSNVQVRNNYIDKTGYAGILLGSDSNYVYRNIIKGAMWTLNDGAAIYTDCSHSTIHNNIIYDTKGDLASSGPWYPLGHGIWLEFLGDFRESFVDSNTIVRSGCNGIFLPNNFSCRITNNVLFDNAEAQLCLEGLETNDYITPPRTQNPAQNNQFQRNVCYATSRKENSMTFQSQFNYGPMAGNYFCNPYTDSVVSGYGTGNYRYTLYDYTLARWRTLFPVWSDATAKTDPIKRPKGFSENKPYGKGTIFINESPAPQTFSLGSMAYVNLDGAPVAGSITVPAFYSTILVYSDSTVGVRPNNTGNPSSLLFKQTGTKVRYLLPTKATVAFDIYDQAGRRVFRAPASQQGPGMHTMDLGRLPLTKKRVAHGVYSYRFSITSSGTATTKVGKVFLVK